MLMKYPVILGVYLAAGLALTHEPAAQTSPLSVVRKDTSKPAQSHRNLTARTTTASQKKPAAPVTAASPPALIWEKRFLEITAENVPQESEMLRELAATIPEDQVYDAIDKLSADRADAAMTMVVFLGQRWAEKSPADAAPWAATHMSDDIYGHNFFTKIMVPWARKDLAAAAAWVRHMPADGNKKAAILSLATEAAALKKAATAIDLASMLPPGSERDDLLDYSAQQWATTDRKGAVAWINTVQDRALREKMLGEVAINIGIQDPAAGAKFAVGAMTAGNDRDNAMDNVIRFWAAATPADAAVWVKQLPDGPMRDRALETLMETWVRKDASEAGRWLNKLPAGHTRDIAANALAHSAT